jgi:hypothetical protein
MVKSEPMNYIVRRRFSHFAWLCSVLTATYEGLFIPSVPMTTATPLFGGSSMTDIGGDFVKSRMAQLHLFLTFIFKIPFLRKDPSLHNFLTVRDEKDFKTITEAPFDVASGGGRENWQNVGLSMWHKLVDGTAVAAADCDRLINDFKRQLELLHNTLKALDKECRAAGGRAVAYAASMSSLAGAMQAWSTLEVDLLDPQCNEYLDPYGAAKRPCVEAMKKGCCHWAQSVEVSGLLSTVWTVWTVL